MNRPHENVNDNVNENGQAGVTDYEAVSEEVLDMSQDESVPEADPGSLPETETETKPSAETGSGSSDAPESDSGTEPENEPETETGSVTPKKTFAEFVSGHKKLLVTLCIIFVAAALAAAAVVFALSPRSRYEFKFETLKTGGLFGWKIYNYRAEFESKNNVSTFEAVKVDGRDCLKIESVSINDARVYREIKVRPSSFYKITVSIRTENVSEGAGANLSGYKMSGKAFSTTGTTDWRRASVYLETLEDQKSVNISLGIGSYGSECSGTAYFEDLVIEKISASDVPEGTVTLKLVPTDRNSSGKTKGVSIWFKLLFAAVMIAAVGYCFFAAHRADRDAASPLSRVSEKNGRFGKTDVIIVLIMTIVTGLISFIGSGSTEGSPDTYWKPSNSGEFVEVSFSEPKTLTRFVYFGGIPRSGSIKLQYLDEETGEFKDTSVKLTKDDIAFYRWSYKNVSFTARTVRLYADSPGLWLNEAGFYETVDGNYVQVVPDVSTIKYEFEETDDSGKPSNLFDEQDEVRVERSLMDSTYFDEIYFPRTAYEQINGLSIYERTHPPLGKVFMEIGILLFGMSTFGWRFSGIFFGTLLVPLVYAFALKVFKKSFWAFVAAFLMMFDFMRLTQTRLATIDTYACFFSLAMTYFMYEYFTVKSYETGFRRSLRPLFLSGLMFGLGAASKWTCIYTGGALAILFFIAKIREILDVKAGRAYSYPSETGRTFFGKKKKAYGTASGEGPRAVTMDNYILSNLLPTLLVCVLFFVVIPAAIYVLSYVQYMPSNPNKSLIQIVIDNQKYMYDYHSGLDATHSYSSMWYTWPIMVRPIWYYVGYNVPAGMRSTISAFGNPAIWWIGVPCVFGSSYVAWRNKDRRMAFFAVAYALQYAPWILVNRVCFIYHYFSAFAFSIFFIVYLIKELTEKKVIPKAVVFVYLALVLALFVIYYPVLTGLPVAQSYIDGLKLFSSWSF
ncbi:MAG: phospholipid carrier-dependent glycosyltransferase [Clostridia bacterium]|nr:phospholipid carrier-dependent glycosyltransferase [Clostridia bacterium]